MATPKIVADFETQLATALSVGDTSFTLASATDDDGAALPAGKYYFTIDNGTSQKEYVVGTVSGTAVTAVSNVTRQGAESSGVDRAHRVGASVIISDFLTYKNYIDETTVAGAADADANTKGVVEVPTSAEIDADTTLGSTGASLAISPDQLVLSKYGTRLPSADEKAAFAGGGDFGTPSTSNKFITEDFLTVASDVQEFSSTGTWTKPADGDIAFIEIWGAGASGSSAKALNDNYAYAPGGGGGAYRSFTIPLSELDATETVTIGAGGAAAVLTATDLEAQGSTGGVSWFKDSSISAAGGVPTDRAITSDTSLTRTGGAGAAAGTIHTVEAGSDGGSSSTSSGSAPTQTFYAGPGGGGATSNTFGAGLVAVSGGTSLLSTSAGGDGDSAVNSDATGTAGVRGGGGGGAAVGGTTGTATSGAGGNGYVRVTVV